jgi:hypothetical protein
VNEVAHPYNLVLNVGSLSIPGDFRSVMPSYTLPADRAIGVGQDVFLDTGTFTQFGTFASTPGGQLHTLPSNTFIKGGASWIVQGGSNTGGFFYLGSSGTGVATYTLNGSGTCNFTLMEIASAASAAFNQNGGYVVTNGLTVGAGTVGAAAEPIRSVPARSTRCLARRSSATWRRSASPLAARRCRCRCRCWRR